MPPIRYHPVGSIKQGEQSEYTELRKAQIMGYSNIRELRDEKIITSIKLYPPTPVGEVCKVSDPNGAVCGAGSTSCNRGGTIIIPELRRPIRMSRRMRASSPAISCTVDEASSDDFVELPMDSVRERSSSLNTSSNFESSARDSALSASILARSALHGKF